jgi:hypothetical protein
MMRPNPSVKGDSHKRASPTCVCPLRRTLGPAGNSRSQAPWQLEAHQRLAAIETAGLRACPRPLLLVVANRTVGPLGYRSMIGFAEAAGPAGSTVLPSVTRSKPRLQAAGSPA